MKPLSIDEMKRLSDFFENKKGENNYYVYVLCDKGLPFYVGKGIGTRCLQHEMSLEELKKERTTKNMSDEELEQLEEELKKELTQKLNCINNAKKKDTFDVAIIKFGLTEHEAYMAESAVINTLKFCNHNLSNIVNGHASKKEKETGEETKARYISELLWDCCPREVSLRDIMNFLNVPDFPFDYMKETAVFINFNDLYPYCENEMDIWDAVRGCWRMEDKKAKEVKYIFAMHNNVIKGIFKVKRDAEADFQKIHSMTSVLEKIPGSNVHHRKSENDMKEMSRVMELLKKNESLRGNVEAIRKELNSDMKKDFYQRGFFNCDINEYKNDEDLLKLKERFQYCYINKKELEMPQISFTFLYDNEYVCKSSSNKIIEGAVLENFKRKNGTPNKEKCKNALNEIYARHGKKFHDEIEQLHFDSKRWYKGTVESDDFDESVLSEAEKKNICILERMLQE